MRYLLILLLLISPLGAKPSPSGVTGTVVLLKGDFMPGPGATSGHKTPVARKIHFYRAARLDQVVAQGEGGFYLKINTAKVAETSSDSKGKFRLALAPATYTMVVEENGKLYANGTDGTYLKPVVVKPNQFTEVIFNIDYQSTW